MFFQSLACGWVGMDPVVVMVIHQFLDNIRQCNTSTRTCHVFKRVSHVAAVHTTHIMITTPEEGICHIMCRAVPAWQTVAIDEWMDAGLRDAHVAGGRLPLGNGSWKAFLCGMGCQSLYRLISRR